MYNITRYVYYDIREKDRAEAIFLTAGTYSKAARHINAAVRNDPSQLLPSQVIAALAIELYFKSLYFIDKNTDFKIKGKHSHDFNALFRDLNFLCFSGQCKKS